MLLNGEISLHCSNWHINERFIEYSKFILCSNKVKLCEKENNGYNRNTLFVHETPIIHVFYKFFFSNQNKEIVIRLKLNDNHFVCCQIILISKNNASLFTLTAIVGLHIFVRCLFSLEFIYLYMY